ncbi:SigE family RNA polymerase sigma factor [Nocardioides ginsengisegetis]|uniref:sigma-70 family RNA polymerase sigma factor n=1 Tax=Nocardioides ginsengisegetis TaxID=661491 RepID=UPI0015FD18C1|nr:sigma-70 family RNA polymerase sigma factor [Nocardioides ginsengisegetis]
MSHGDFHDYVEARWTNLCRFAVLLGSSQQDAEDLVQTSLADCWASWDRIRKSRDVDAYVYRVVINRWRRTRRNGRKESESLRFIGEPATAAFTDSVDDALAVRSALSRLPPDMRVILTLRRLADLSEAQTASVLRIPIGTVKSRLARAQALFLEDPAISSLRTQENR